MAAPDAFAATVHRVLAVCGWRCRGAGGSNRWWCGRPFGHTEPHALFSEGRIVAESPGYRTG